MLLCQCLLLLGLGNVAMPLIVVAVFRECCYVAVVAAFRKCCYAIDCCCCV